MDHDDSGVVQVYDTHASGVNWMFVSINSSFKVSTSVFICFAWMVGRT
jgi:hypothetical protein